MCRMPRSHHIGWGPSWTPADYNRGQQKLRTALTKQLRMLGMKPSLELKTNAEGRQEWVVEPLQLR
jgi:hypothetical protein